MSALAQRDAWQRAVFASPELTSAAKIVGAVIALHMNLKTGACFPSVERLASGASLTERAVQKAVRALEHLGFLSVKRTRGRTSNSFALLMERVTERLEAASEEAEDTVRSEEDSDRPTLNYGAGLSDPTLNRGSGFMSIGAVSTPNRGTGFKTPTLNGDVTQPRTAVHPNRRGTSKKGACAKDDRPNAKPTSPPIASTRFTKKGDESGLVFVRRDDDSAFWHHLRQVNGKPLPGGSFERGFGAYLPSAIVEAARNSFQSRKPATNVSSTASPVREGTPARPRLVHPVAAA